MKFKSVGLRGWHTGFGPRAHLKGSHISNEVFFGRMLIFEVRQLFSVKITKFFLNNILDLDPWLIEQSGVETIIGSKPPTVEVVYLHFRIHHLKMQDTKKVYVTVRDASKQAIKSVISATLSLFKMFSTNWCQAKCFLQKINQTDCVIRILLPSSKKPVPLSICDFAITLQSIYH